MPMKRQAYLVRCRTRYQYDGEPTVWNWVLLPAKGRPPGHGEVEQGAGTSNTREEALVRLKRVCREGGITRMMLPDRVQRLSGEV